MNITDAPYPAKNLLPGMYALHEEAMCRRKAAGGIAWNWNTGLASPVLSEKGPC
jgi:para-nitrobenzyl esterase